MYVNNLLVPSRRKRQRLINISHQAHLRLKTTFNHNEQFWLRPEKKADIKKEWETCEECAHCKKSKMQSPSLFPVDLMSFDVGEL